MYVVTNESVVTEDGQPFWTGRTVTVVGIKDGVATTYFPVPSGAYWPHGAIQSLILENDVTMTYDYAAGTNNGNPQSQTIHHDAVGSEAAFTVIQNYTTYDGANWLAGFLENGHSQAYGFDEFGNRWVNPSDSVYPANPLTPTQQSVYDPTTNRLIIVNDCNGNTVSSGYDQGGNLKYHCPFTLGYEGENRQVSATSATLSVSAIYGYDGNGQRVQKVIGGTTTNYIYDAFGKLVATATPSGPGGREYYTADHLGSTRLITNAGGGVSHRYDYLPFGEGLSPGVNGRSPMYSAYNGGAYPASDGETVKFTGTERDEETGLDFFGARYLSGAESRFTGADGYFSSMHLFFPQSLNRYVYVGNNPLSFVDPNGHDCAFVYNGNIERVDTVSNPEECSDSGGYWVYGPVNQVEVSDGTYRFGWFASDEQGNFAVRTYDSYIGPGELSDQMSPLGASVVPDLGRRSDASNAFIGIFAGAPVIGGGVVASLPTVGTALGTKLNEMAFGAAETDYSMSPPRHGSRDKFRSR